MEQSAIDATQIAAYLPALEQAANRPGVPASFVRFVRHLRSFSLMPSLEEDIAAAVDVLGLHATGIVFGIGMTNWKSAEERDAFLRLIGEEQANGSA